jgi:hypothetical protein
MKKNTANTGAAIERGKLLAKLRRMEAAAYSLHENGDVYFSSEEALSGFRTALTAVREWVNKSASRAQAKPGGLGRKPKKLKAA